MSEIAMLPSLIGKLLPEILSTLVMSAAGSSGSGITIPLGSSGITLSVNMETGPGGPTITLRFSGSVHAAVAQLAGTVAAAPRVDAPHAGT